MSCFRVTVLIFVVKMLFISAFVFHVLPSVRSNPGLRSVQQRSRKNSPRAFFCTERLGYFPRDVNGISNMASF